MTNDRPCQSHSHKYFSISQPFLWLSQLGAYFMVIAIKQKINHWKYQQVLINNHKKSCSKCSDNNFYQQKKHWRGRGWCPWTEKGQWLIGMQVNKSIPLSVIKVLWTPLEVLDINVRVVIFPQGSPPPCFYRYRGSLGEILTSLLSSLVEPVTAGEYWPLMGQCYSCDLNTDLWLVITENERSYCPFDDLEVSGTFDDLDVSGTAGDLLSCARNRERWLESSYKLSWSFLLTEDKNQLKFNFPYRDLRLTLDRP